MNSNEIKDGLLEYSLNNKVIVVTTYDNKVWGNMNQYFATTPEEKTEIDLKDRKIQDILSTKLLFSLTTPPEDTIMDLNRNSFDYLKTITKPESDGYTFGMIRANGILIRDTSEDCSIAFAPADCPILLLVPNDGSFIVAIHLGAPQLFQGLHLKVFNYLKAVYPNIDMKSLSGYLTPYVCKDHYSISKEKYNFFSSKFRDIELLNKYVSKKFNEVYKEDRYYVDFVGFLKEELQSTGINLAKIAETGVCAYEASQGGNLFSHELIQELEILEKEGQEIDWKKYRGRFNVLIGIKALASL